MANPKSTDGKSSPEYFLIREERISDMREFSRMLSEAIVNVAKGDASKTALLGSNISTRCPRCEIKLTGDELLSISQPDESERSPKAQRMYLGYCPRKDCDATLSEVAFHRYPGLDWESFFSEMQRLQQNRNQPTVAAVDPKKAALSKELWRKIGRFAIGLAAIGILLLVWQWRRGGRIPYLREPEKFHVTPLSPGQKE